MHITILAIGTRGDIQPLVALGVGLQQTGRHRARLVAPDDFAALVHGAGLDFSPLGISVREMLNTKALRPFVEPGGNLLLGFGQMLRLMRPMMSRMMENTWLACQEAEFIVFSTLGLGAYHIAEKLGVPCASTASFPASYTRAFPNIGFPALPLGGGYNWLTYFLAEKLIQLLTGWFFDRWRKERLGLPPIPRFAWPYDRLNGRPVPRLYSFSPVVFPPPPDWDEDVYVTGYWFLDPPPDWQPPASLVDCLASGSPPVYVGFGSLPHRNAQQMTRTVLEALRLAGQRGVMATGWGGLMGDGRLSLPDEVFTIESIHHAWLFPHMAAVIHHGGCGTSGAGLRSGAPSILVPHTGDQPLWARQVEALGAGPRPIPLPQLTAERLADAITRAITDQELRARAAALGERIRAEDGLVQAVAIIERCGNIAQKERDE